MTKVKRILLVDDDTVTNMLHRRVIERSGRTIHVDVATDGQEALDVLNADMAKGCALPELIFLDINMPGMGGFEFLEHYAHLDIPSKDQLIVVMLSTSLLPHDHWRADADPNVYRFCEKPLKPALLLSIIEDYQDLRSEGRSVA